MRAALSLLRRPRGGRFLAEALYRLGIRHLFSVPGAQVLSVWDGITRVDGLRLVAAGTEWNAAFMAEGYGLAGGRPAAVMSTLGPGVANELVGMESAWRSGAPILFVSPCHPPHKRKEFGFVFQGLDHERFFAGIGRPLHRVDSASQLADELERALGECLDDSPGPVRVEVSFPLLFERHRFGRAPTRTSDPLDPVDGIVYCETSARARPPAWLGAAAAGFQVLSPGLEEAGHAIPCALGARFARDDVPALAITTVDLLVDNAECISLALHHGLEVNLIARHAAAYARVCAVAGGRRGARCLAVEDDAELPAILLEAAKALSIVVESRPC